MDIDDEMYETLIERLKVDRIYELVVPLDNFTSRSAGSTRYRQAGLLTTMIWSRSYTE